MRLVLGNHRNVMVLAIVVLVATVLIRNDTVWLERSIIAAIYSLMAVSVGISFGRAGVLSVAQAAFASIGGYGAAVISGTYDINVIVGLAFAIAAPAAVAYPIARAVARLSHLSVAIATLVLGEVLVVVARELDITGGFIGIAGIPQPSLVSSRLHFHVLAWLLVLAVIWWYSNLDRTAQGRNLRTIRIDVLRAQADGSKTAHDVAMVFAVSASIAGIAGWLYAHYIRYMSPDSLPPSLSISVILMAVIGGVSYVAGPVVGACALLLIETYLPGEATRGMLYGAAIVVIFLVAPNGLMGALAQGWRTLAARRSSVRHAGAPVEPMHAVEVSNDA